MISLNFAEGYPSILEKEWIEQSWVCPQCWKKGGWQLALWSHHNPLLTQYTLIFPPDYCFFLQISHYLLQKAISAVSGFLGEPDPTLWLWPQLRPYTSMCHYLNSEQLRPDSPECRTWHKTAFMMFSFAFSFFTVLGMEPQSSHRPGKSYN